MKWVKQGMIFSTDQFNLIYAKSPQAIIFDNFIRVYFSTCRKDGDKLVSYVSFVDYDKRFTSIINVSKHPVLEDGMLGCYDEHGIFPFSPLRHESKLLGYISGWTRRVSVSCDSGIGLAESHDNGDSFIRYGNGPVLSSSLNEPFLIIDGFVRVFSGVFHMWYIYGTSWHESPATEPERTYRIAHATSKDGINWDKEGKLIIEAKSKFECQALPSVIKIGEIYYMYFCYRDTFDFRFNKNNSYRIGYAYSYDLVSWSRSENLSGLELSNNGWDSEMMCYPHLMQVDENIYLLYNGNLFGRYGFGLAKLINNNQ